MIPLPTPETIILVILFAGVGYVNQEYWQPKYAIATFSPVPYTDTVRLYKKVKPSSYFCPPYCAVDHNHFVHKLNNCNQKSCNHMVIDSVVEYIKIEKHNKKPSNGKGTPLGPPIRLTPKPWDWDL